MQKELKLNSGQNTGDEKKMDLQMRL